MPNFTTAASDWCLASLGGFAFARYSGAGVFGFRLRSASLNTNEPFILCATGVGSGGNASGFDLGNLDGLRWSDPGDGVQRPFSLTQIHRSSGTMISGSLGMGRGSSAPGNLMSVGWSRLDSAVDGVTFFSSSGIGFSGGSGTGSFAFVGTWYSYALNNNSINPIRPYWQNVVEMGEQIRNLPGRVERDMYRLVGM